MDAAENYYAFLLNKKGSTTSIEVPASFSAAPNNWCGAYGTTQSGRTNGSGTVFTISSNGALTSLYSFTGGNDGGSPQAGLVQGSDSSSIRGLRYRNPLPRRGRRSWTGVEPHGSVT